MVTGGKRMVRLRSMAGWLQGERGWLGQWYVGWLEGITRGFGGWYP